MTKFLKIIITSIAIGLLTGCSQILQTVDLEINSEDNSLQEKFNVVEKTLTIEEARAQKNAAYLRTVLQNGRGEDAQPIPEELALKSKFPKINVPVEYKVGIGDTITFSRLIENNRSPSDTESVWPKQKVELTYKLGIGDTLDLTMINKAQPINPIPPNNSASNQNLIVNSQQSDSTITSSGRIGSDGSVLLLEVGRLEASGKSLNELRSEVRNILIRNGISPRFQLEISSFQSQKAYLTVNAISNVIFLEDQKTTVRDVLTSAGIGFRPGVITRVKLQRDSKEYSILLRDIYSKNAADINIRSGDHIFVQDSSADIISTSSTVDKEGNVVFPNVGKINAVGRSLDALRTEIKKLIQRVPDSQNAFQIQITKFSSQTALLNIPGRPGAVVPITDTAVALAEVLSQSGLQFDNNTINQLKLWRDGNTYLFTLEDLLNPNKPTVYLQAGDRITVNNLPYKENKVFILGGVSPQIFKINPANRETLADVLFTGGGPLSTASANRSEVYLLRGSNPVVAYHLDAQSPTRLIVADAMELRPNDILYVAEQPIISFNRTLATIVPLRILVRDIQDENIP